VQYNTLDLIRPGLTNIQLSFSGIVLAENDSSGWDSITTRYCLELTETIHTTVRTKLPPLPRTGVIRKVFRDVIHQLLHVALHYTKMMNNDRSLAQRLINVKLIVAALFPSDQLYPRSIHNGRYCR